LTKKLALNSILLRFFTSSGVSTTCHWALMWGLVYFGISATPATGLGSAFGAIVNYWLQYYHTFKSKKAHSDIMMMYVLTCIFGWLLNIAIFEFIYSSFLGDVLLSQLITTGVVAFFNFTIFHKVVFHERSIT